jgi:RNA polymerase sigma-70 factor (ECF subfamily)
VQQQLIDRRPLLGTEPEPADSVDTLLSRVASAEPEAFAALYDRVAPAVFGIAQRVLRNRAMAEEVAHDALLDIWAQCRTFDRTRGSALAWVLTIAHRRAVDAVRREQAARDRDERASTRSWERPRDVVAEAVIQTLGDARLRKALSQLTPLQRSAIQLAYYDGCTHQEVAQTLDVPLGTAKSRINDGLRRLRGELRADG